jgi:hypothetical protein
MAEHYERPFTITVADDWHFIAFDKTQFYLNQYQQIENVTGCDWVASSSGSHQVVLLELKEEKAEQDLIKEAALKFHHTIAGLLLAPICSNSEPQEGLTQAASCFQQETSKRLLVLLTEFVPRPPHRAFPLGINLLSIQTKLRQRFKPLRFDVFVVNSTDFSSIPGLEDWQVTVTP